MYRIKPESESENGRTGVAFMELKEVIIQGFHSQ